MRLSRLSTALIFLLLLLCLGLPQALAGPSEPRLYLPLALSPEQPTPPPPEGLVSDFETDLAGWTGVDGTIALEAASRPGSTGSRCLRLTGAEGMPWACAWAFAAPVRAGGWYRLDAWIVRRTSSSAVGTDVRRTGDHDTYLAPWNGAWLVDTWKRVISTFHARDATVDLQFSGGTHANGAYMNLDDAACTRIPWTEMLGNMTAATDTVTVGVQVTHPENINSLGIRGQAGVIANLDNPTEVRNGVLAYLHWADSGLSSTVVLEKCINGEWTVLLETPVSYAAGAYLELARAGNTYTVHYNGTAVGSAVIADEEITRNRLHGSFRTTGEIALGGFRCVDG